MPDMPNDNSDYLQKLKDLLGKAGQNIDNSGQMINQQADLAVKQLHQPDYQPSPAEAANQDKYYNSVTGAVAGSLAPVKGASELAAEANPGIIQRFQNLLGKGEMSTQDMLTNAQNIHARALQKGLQSPINQDLMSALQQRSGAELTKQQTTQAAVEAARKKALSSLAGQ